MYLTFVAIAFAISKADRSTNIQFRTVLWVELVWSFGFAPPAFPNKITNVQFRAFLGGNLVMDFGFTPLAFPSQFSYYAYTDHALMRQRGR